MQQLVDTVSQHRNEDDVYQLVTRAQDGDTLARDLLIRSYTPFVMKVASSSAKRYLVVGRDDEASIALIAFNEAISVFSLSKGRSFFTFAETVIRRRLIDLFRRQGSHSMEIPASSFTSVDEDNETVPNPMSRAEVKLACDAVAQHDETWERREEIKTYSTSLAAYKIKFDDLVNDSPKHTDARQRAIEAARLVASVPELRRHLQAKRELPLKELEKLVSVSRKTLERQRRYIIALAVIFMGDFRFLKEYVR